MTIFNIFVINRAGSLIFDYDTGSKLSVGGFSETVEMTFDDPSSVDFRFDLIDNRPTVIFGQRQGVKPGFIVVHCNGLETGLAQNFFQILSDNTRYPLTMKFQRALLNTNEKIILSSMFHSLHAIAAQLSPVSGSQGIQSLETDHFRLQCFQSLTGIKFACVSDHSHSLSNLDQFLRRIYELYSDYAAKNPFYSLDMPIRCELFDQNLKTLLEKVDRANFVNI